MQMDIVFRLGGIYLYGIYTPHDEMFLPHLEHLIELEVCPGVIYQVDQICWVYSAERTVVYVELVVFKIIPPVLEET